MDKKIKILPSLDLLNYLFELDVDSGLLIRKVRCGNQKEGQIAGSINHKGYLQVSINTDKRNTYYLHRVVWKMYYKTEPPEILDHKDRNKLNNRIDNLREVTKEQNQQTRQKNANNTSGEKGVFWDKTKKKWLVQIRANGKVNHLGRYANKNKAIAVAKDAYLLLHTEFNGNSQ
jgi:hypothetical protein